MDWSFAAKKDLEKLLIGQVGLNHGSEEAPISRGHRVARAQCWWRDGLNVARECVASLADAGCVLPSWFESALWFRRTLAILSSHLAAFRVEHRGRTAFV